MIFNLLSFIYAFNVFSFKESFSNPEIKNLLKAKAHTQLSDKNMEKILNKNEKFRDVRLSLLIYPYNRIHYLIRQNRQIKQRI